jgi:NAD-dependent aldehyde dehydrogenases
MLIALARLILENRDRLARLIIAEQGKPLQEARGEVEGTALYLTYAAEEARRITGDIIPSDNADEQVWIERVAHGVVVGLTAWNYPAALTTRKMGPALLAGNTIVSNLMRARRSRPSRSPSSRPRSAFPPASSMW